MPRSPPCVASLLRNFLSLKFWLMSLGLVGVGASMDGAAERGRHAAPAVVGRFAFFFATRLGS